MMIKLKNIISVEKPKPKPQINEVTHRGDTVAYFDSGRYIALEFPRLGIYHTVKTFDREWVNADEVGDHSIWEGIEKTMGKCNDKMNKIANDAEKEIKAVLRSTERELTSQEKTWKRKNR